MSPADETVEAELKWQTRGGEVSKTWKLKMLSNGPANKFVFFDEDEEPRLFVDPEDLMEMKADAKEAVLDR